MNRGRRRIEWRMIEGCREKPFCNLLSSRGNYPSFRGHKPRIHRRMSKNETVRVTDPCRHTADIGL